MPTLTIITSTEEKKIKVETNKRLVLAIEESGIDIGHRCGGYAGCTTCRVEFIEGEPSKMTKAEQSKLKEKEILGKYRLACQILCTHDMKVKPAILVSEKGWDNPGNMPKEGITPDPEWIMIESN